MENTIFMLYSSLVGMIPIVLITAGCLIFWRKVKGVATTMMLSANIAVLISKASAIVVSVLLQNNSLTLETYNKYAIGFRIISILISFVFALGFYLMANRLNRNVEHPA
jgi:hypothetical protein